MKTIKPYVPPRKCFNRICEKCGRHGRCEKVTGLCGKCRGKERTMDMPKVVKKLKPEWIIDGISPKVPGEQQCQCLIGHGYDVFLVNDEKCYERFESTACELASAEGLGSLVSYVANK